ncbi:hypothetical protein H4R24_003435 [Coemansia sp. RSA 988]|nr:hypothetical protein H4R24_003435 [Coemansia sp. RSA 988]
MNDKPNFQKMPRDIFQRIIHFSEEKKREPIEEHDSAQKVESVKGKEPEMLPNSEQQQSMEVDEPEKTPKKSSSKNHRPLLEVCHDWRTAAKHYLDNPKRTKVDPESTDGNDPAQISSTRPRVLLRKKKDASETSESTDHLSKLAGLFKH